MPIKKYMRRACKLLLSILGAVAAAALCLCAVVFLSSQADKRKFAGRQQAHIAALEAAYSRPDYIPADEKTLTGFDVDAAVREGLRLNEIRFIATHNSYKAYNPMAEWIMDRLVASLGLGDRGIWSYGFEPLSQQLDSGIRSFELDVMREKGGFRCAHAPVVDYASNCPDFGLALKEIALWSEHHPGHLPVTVLVEAKASALSGGMLYHKFNMDDVLALDKLVADALGARLCAPAELLGAHETFARLRSGDGYPPLSALLGKVIVIYHYDWRGTTRAYVAQDPTVRSLSMFPSAAQWMRYEDIDPNQDYACFLLDNWSGSEYIEVFSGEHNMLVRVRSDAYPWRMGEWPWEADARETGAFIISTDFPPRGDSEGDTHPVTFEGGATVARR